MKMRWSSVIWMQGKFRFSGKKLSHPLSGDNLEQKHDFWKNNHKTQFYPDLMSEQKCNLRLPLKITRRLSHIFEETSSVVKKLIFEEKILHKAIEIFCCIFSEVQKIDDQMQQTGLGQRIEYFSRQEKTQKCIRFFLNQFSKKSNLLLLKSIMSYVCNKILFWLTTYEAVPSAKCGVWMFDFCNFVNVMICQILQGEVSGAKRQHFHDFVFLQRSQIEFLLKSSGSTDLHHSQPCSDLDLIMEGYIPMLK